MLPDFPNLSSQLSKQKGSSDIPINLLKPQDWSSINKLAGELDLWWFIRIALFGFGGYLKIELYDVGRSLFGCLEDRTDQSSCQNNSLHKLISPLSSRILAPRPFPNYYMNQNTNTYTMLECKIYSYVNKCSNAEFPSDFKY